MPKTLNKPAASWHVREASGNDLDPIRTLYASVWGYNRPSQFDQWRFFSLPEGPVPAALAVDGKRLAGSYSVWPTKLRVGNNVVLGAQSMDTMTHPDYQGQGVFTKLAESCYEIAKLRGYKVLYGFPNPQSYPGFVKRLGWTHTGDITHWVRLLKPSMHPKVPPLGRVLVDTLAKLLPTGRSTDFNFKRTKPNDDELQPLLDHWRNETGICKIDRTAEWLAWRYAKESENNYRWVSAYQNETLIAAGIWGKQSPAWGNVGDNRAHLVELFGKDQQGLRAVLAEIISDATAANSMVLETLCNIDYLCKIFRRAGFYRHRQAPFIVKCLDSSLPITKLLTHENWCIMGGDVDTF